MGSGISKSQKITPLFSNVKTRLPTKKDDPDHVHHNIAIVVSYLTSKKHEKCLEYIKVHYNELVTVTAVHEKQKNGKGDTYSSVLKSLIQLLYGLCLLLLFFEKLFDCKQKKHLFSSSKRQTLANLVFQAIECFSSVIYMIEKDESITHTNKPVLFYIAYGCRGLARQTQWTMIERDERYERNIKKQKGGHAVNVRGPLEIVGTSMKKLEAVSQNAELSFQKEEEQRNIWIQNDLYMAGSVLYLFFTKMINYKNRLPKVTPQHVYDWSDEFTIKIIFWHKEPRDVLAWMDPAAMIFSQKNNKNINDCEPDDSSMASLEVHTFSTIKKGSPSDQTDRSESGSVYSIKEMMYGE